MNGKLRTVLAVILVIAALPLTMAATQTSSFSSDFNTTPTLFRFNWTNDYAANLTIGVNGSLASETIRIHNETTSGNVQRHSISRNYSQPVLNSTLCGASGDPVESFVVTGGTNAGNLTEISGNETGDVTLSFASLVECSPGRYYGSFNTTVESNTSEFTSTEAFVDIPISDDNTITASTGEGNFKGILPASASTYQSYFFNSSLLGANSVYIDADWLNSSQDLDLFLFDSDGDLLARGITHNTTNETLYYGRLPSNEFLEIRVFGTSDTAIDYNGTGHFWLSSINPKDTSAGTEISTVDFGSVNVSSATTTSNQDVTLTTDQINYTDIDETQELWFERTITSTSAGTHAIRVPTYVTKITAEVNWTGNADYNLTLKKPDATVVATSKDKDQNTNTTLDVDREFVLYEPTGSTIGADGDEGTWNVTMTLDSGDNTGHTIVVKQYLDIVDRVSSNFTDDSALETSGSSSEVDFIFNYTTNTSTLTGLHKGNLIYRDGVIGSRFLVPFQINLTEVVNMTGFDVVDTDLEDTENIVANVSLRYPDGSAENSLVKQNFTATLNGVEYSSASDSQTVNSTAVAQDKYAVTVDIAAGQPGGNYTLTIGASVPRDGQTLTNSTALASEIIVDNPGLEMEKVSLPDEFDEDETKTVKVRVVNHGPDALDGSAASVKIEISETGEISSISFNEDDTTCTTSGTPTTEVEFDVSEDGAANDADQCVIAWDVTAGDIDDDATITIEGSGNYWYNSLTETVEIVEASSTSSSSSTAASDDTADADENSSITLQSFPATKEIVQGASGTASITVKNDGDTDETGLEVYVTGLTASWYSVPTNFDLDQGDESTFSITFNIPSDATVKEYAISYGVKNANVDASEAAVLKVLPSEETIANLTTTASALRNALQDLEDLLDRVRSGLTEAQANLIDEDVATIRSKLAEAEAAIEAGDNFKAASLLAEVEALIESTRTSLESVEPQGGGSGIVRILLISLGIAAALGVVGLVVYMMLPPKTGVVESVAPAQSAPPTDTDKKSLWDRIKEMFKSKKKGYDTSKGYSY